MHKAGEDFQQVIRQQHLVPQVIGRIAARVFRDLVTRAALFSAFVERQEEGVVAREFGRHIDVELADGEVHQRPAFKGQQRFGFVGERIFR